MRGKGTHTRARAILHTGTDLHDLVEALHVWVDWVLLLWLPKGAGEAHVCLGLQFLVAEEDHLVLDERCVPVCVCIYNVGSGGREEISGSGSGSGSGSV